MEMGLDSLALQPKFVLRLIREASTTSGKNENRVQKNVQSVSFLVVRGKAAQPPKCSETRERQRDILFLSVDSIHVMFCRKVVNW